MIPPFPELNPPRLLVAALETCLRQNGYRAKPGVDAALSVYRAAEQPQQLASKAS